MTARSAAATKAAVQKSLTQRVRQKLGMTQSDLACILGRHPQIVARWEEPELTGPMRTVNLKHQSVDSYCHAFLLVFERAAAAGVGKAAIDVLRSNGAPAAMLVLLTAGYQQDDGRPPEFLP